MSPRMWFASRRPWSSSEIRLLSEKADEGAAACARALDRSVRSVKMAAHRYRISLRSAGETRGRFIGEASSMPEDLRAELRARVLSGDVDVASLERRMRRPYLIAMGAPLCPACGTNPQEITWTGFCEDCHWVMLADAHRRDEAERRKRSDAERDYEQAKKQAQRRRVS